MDLVQINLHHSKMATASLVDFISRSNIVAALIQEPWIDKDGTICGLNINGFVLCCKNGKNRSCILIRKHINFFFLDNYSDEDFTAVVLEKKGAKPICLCSAYCPYEELDNFPSCNFIRVAKETKWISVIGCDANAHHSQWGSEENNFRGEQFFNYLLKSNLVLCNLGNEATFFNKKSKTIVDVTLITSGYCYLIKNWRVSKEASLSDHAWITFNLDLCLNKEAPFINPQCADWEKFSLTVNAALTSPLEDINNSGELDLAVNKLTNILVPSYEKSLPKHLLRGRGKKKPPWWNTEISHSMKEARSSLNRSKSLIMTRLGKCINVRKEP